MTAVGVILLLTFVGFLFGTLYVNAYPFSSRELILGIKYVQFFGLILGFVVGVLLSAFCCQVSFLEKIRSETFSFVALVLALFGFFGNLIAPQFASETLLTLTASTGQRLSPSEPVLLFSILISTFLAIIIGGLVFGILNSKER